MNIKVIDPVVHNIIDYFSILLLWLSPSIFGLSGVVTIVLYILGFIHLFITVCTISPLGLFKVIPFKIHGWIELSAGIILMALPWILQYSDNILGTVISLIYSFSLIILWFLSNYNFMAKKRKIT